MSADEPTPPRGRRPQTSGLGLSVRSTIVVLIGAFGTLVGIGVLVTTFMVGSTDMAEQPEEVASVVRLEPVLFRGENPFMALVGGGQPLMGAMLTASGQFSGDTPALYAHNGNQTSCDVEALIRNLREDASRAAAWAMALGLAATDIPAFARTLTPVILRSDTAVTSHGYRDGTFVSYPAVLQAGTAVLVDSYGEPTVKCYSGNPLTAPSPEPATDYVGEGWEAFDPASVIVIRPASTPIKEFTFVHVRYGRRMYTPGKTPWPPRRHERDWEHTWGPGTGQGVPRLPEGGRGQDDPQETGSPEGGKRVGG